MRPGPRHGGPEQRNGPARRLCRDKRLRLLGPQLPQRPIHARSQLGRFSLGDPGALHREPEKGLPAGGEIGEDIGRLRVAIHLERLPDRPCLPGELGKNLIALCGLPMDEGRHRLESVR